MRAYVRLDNGDHSDWFRMRVGTVALQHCFTAVLMFAEEAFLRDAVVNRDFVRGGEGKGKRGMG